MVYRYIFKLYLYKSVSDVSAKRDFIRFISFYFRVRKLTFFDVMRDINTLVPLPVLRNGLGRTMNTRVLHTIIVYVYAIVLIFTLSALHKPYKITM